ncbi:hypothetical protein CPC08DRAFT_483642 [Agrocybe pediades]|nr:hypothetical protein CPC08DRAFT_483642 [Agrocybe pediades]
MYNSVSTSSPDFQELLGESAPSDVNATLTTSVSVPEMEEDIHRRYVVNPEVTTALGPEFQSLSLAEHLVALNPTNPSSFMISSKVARSQLVRVMFRVLKLEDANRKLNSEVVAALRDHNKIFRLYYAEKHDRRHDRKDDRLKILSLEEDSRLLRTHVDYLKDDSQRHQQKNAELTSKLAQSERFFDALLDVKTCGPVLRDAVSAINEGGSAEEELVHAIMSAYAREDSIWRRIIDAVAGPRCPDVQAHESPVAPLWPGDIPPSNSQISEVYHQIFDDSNSDLSQVSPEVVSVGSVEENVPGSSAGEKEREAEVSPMTSLPVEQQEEVIKVTPATSPRRKSPVKATPARASPSKVPTPARNVPVSAPPSRVRAAPGHSRTTSVPIRPRVAAHDPAVRSSLPSTLSRISPPLKAPSTMSAPRTVGTMPKPSISRSANAVPGPSRVQSSGASTARSLLKAPSAVPRKRSPLGSIDLNRAQTTSDGNGEEDERSLPAHGSKPVESLPKPAARPLGKRHARIIVEKLDLPPSNVCLLLQV